MRYAHASATHRPMTTGRRFRAPIRLSILDYQRKKPVTTAKTANRKPATRPAWEAFDDDLGDPVQVASKADLDAIDTALELQLISIRLPRGLIKQLKLISKYRGVGYQPLVRDLLLRFARSEMRSILIEIEEKAKLESQLSDVTSPAAKFFEQKVAAG